MNKKVGRNDPCPCGSGKKYKQCCEKLGKTLKFKASLIGQATSKGMPSLFQKAVQEESAASTAHVSSILDRQRKKEAQKEENA